MSSRKICRKTHAIALTSFALSGAVSISAMAAIVNTITGADQNALFGVDENNQSFPPGNRGSNGGGDQSLQSGDVLSGTEQSDLATGAPGIDANFGNDGPDILVGGTEDFNPFNRDRAFGGKGNAVFLCAPCDVNDSFDEGSQTDDDGLRVAVSLRNVEQVVCTKRVVIDGLELANTEILDITTSPPTVAELSDLPEFVQQQIQKKWAL